MEPKDKNKRYMPLLEKWSIPEPISRPIPFPQPDRTIVLALPGGKAQVFHPGDPHYDELIEACRKADIDLPWERPEEPDTDEED